MKPRFKGFAIIPVIGVFFLLVISGVTSYVAINRGTGGYKARAASASCFVGLNSRCNQRTTLQCPDATIFCASPNVCSDSNGSPVTGTKVGTCQAKSTTGGGTNYGQGDGSCASQKGGICKATSSSCAGTFQSGFCPGPATWKCCVPSTGGGTTDTPTTDTPTTDTPTTDTPTTAPTVTTGNAKVALTMKLQGVGGLPAGSTTVPFKAKLKNATSTTDYVTGTLTADSSGKWTGAADFTNIPLGTENGYSIFVKVGKHFQKKVCVASPTETLGGTYSCSENGITLAAGENSLDFSNILQLVGDLPSASGEQNGVVDSYDKGFILNNQRSTSASVLETGDLNFDGVIDTNDWSLILQSLNVKVDDSDK